MMVNMHLFNFLNLFFFFSLYFSQRLRLWFVICIGIFELKRKIRIIYGILIIPLGHVFPFKVNFIKKLLIFSYVFPKAILMRFKKTWFDLILFGLSINGFLRWGNCKKSAVIIFIH
jgi:hypothetical protein